MFLAVIIFASILLGGWASDANAQAVEAIIVDKSDRKLWLVRDGQKAEEFDVRLGQQPIGHKQERGDLRTPEGKYFIEWRNDQSKYYRSFKISYPNKIDRAKAKLAMRDPGDNIFVHGTKNGLSKAKAALAQEFDWTLGCIALKNTDIDYLWQVVEDGTPIHIHP